MEKWLASYERRRRSKNPLEPSEGWQSSKYDFSNPDVRLEYVPEMGFNVSGCISGLKKLWKSYKIAGRNGEPRSWQAYSINKIQGALGLELSSFPETEGMTNDFEEQTDEEEKQLR